MVKKQNKEEIDSYIISPGAPGGSVEIFENIPKLKSLIFEYVHKGPMKLIMDPNNKSHEILVQPTIAEGHCEKCGRSKWSHVILGLIEVCVVRSKTNIEEPVYVCPTPFHDPASALSGIDCRRRPQKKMSINKNDIIRVYFTSQDKFILNPKVSIVFIRLSGKKE